MHAVRVQQPLREHSNRLGARCASAAGRAAVQAQLDEEVRELEGERARLQAALDAARVTSVSLRRDKTGLEAKVRRQCRSRTLRS